MIQHIGVLHQMKRRAAAVAGTAVIMHRNDFFRLLKQRCIYSAAEQLMRARRADWTMNGMWGAIVCNVMKKASEIQKRIHLWQSASFFAQSDR
jgi:hypothetical protein